MADGRVAEEFLNDAQVSAVFEQVCREAVAEHVWRDVARDAGAADALFDAKPQGDRGARGAAFGEKDVGWRTRGHELWPADREVAFERSDGFFSHRQDALFVAFADDVDESGFEMELFEADAAQLGEAQAGSVGEF